MTALYCYMVSYYCYSDSMFIPMFHEKKFTKEEFKEICNKIREDITKSGINKYMWEYPQVFMKYAKKYGFKDVDILEVDSENGKVGTYLRYETDV